MAKPSNILFIMADQLAASALPAYGHALVDAPHMTALAEGGVVFDSAYCNFPLCAPSRFSLLSGRLASRIAAYDNAAEFAAATPTIAHYLRSAGYRTVVGGKMHFIGADQLHGFEERLTTDIYPADFGWTPDWRAPDAQLEWFHSLVNVVEAGPCERSLQIDFDDEVAFAATRKIFDLARDDDPRPFFLMVSFSHPHDPYTATKAYWERYDHDAIPLPAVGFIPPEARDPHSRRLYDNYDRGEYRITEDHMRGARHAYYAMISYLDDKIGGLLAALAAAGLAEDTIIVLTSDHGDMLGERGLWYKMSFFEDSARVPLIVHAPGRFEPRRVAENVSLVDLLPTFLDLAGIDKPLLDGHSLAPLMAGRGEGWPDTALGEFTAEGAVAPLFMVRRGAYKYIACAADPPQLYDLANDPHEQINLAGEAAHGDAERELAAVVAETWDSDVLSRRVMASQERRRMVFDALMTGKRSSWDYRTPLDESRDYIRNSGALYDAERRARLPRRDTPKPDGEG
jgi:choline-sulfatase